MTPSPGEIDALIAAHPLAQLVSHGPAGFIVTPVPLLLERDAGGATLVGHLARTNRHVAVLEEAPHALAIFTGDHRYVSPGSRTDRTQAPTWTYATVQMHVRVEIDRSAEAGSAAVRRLSAAMEAGRGDPVVARRDGARFDRLLPGIVAFRAHVLGTTARFKL